MPISLFLFWKGLDFDFPEGAVWIAGWRPADLDKKVTVYTIIGMDIGNVSWNYFFWKDDSKGGLGLSLCKAEFEKAENEKGAVFICKYGRVPLCLHSFQL